jgi:hypothetical protein
MLMGSYLLGLAGAILARSALKNLLEGFQLASVLYRAQGF